MNNIERVFSETDSLRQFADGYFKYLYNLLNGIEITAIETCVEELEDARTNNNTVFLAGNGGSAATATTMANDLGFDLIKKARIDKPLRVLALTDNNAVMTAIANDVGYENIFIDQLKIHYRTGDKLIAISASGNSPNVVAAAEWVKKQGGRVISFVGFTGGKLKEISDVVVHAKSEAGEYGPVEDVHLIMNHILAHWFQNKLKQTR